MPRFIHLSGGFALNVKSVARLEYLSAHDRREETRVSGEDLGEYPHGAVVIRYERDQGIYISVDDEEWGAELIKRLTREFAHGTEKIIDPYSIKRDMENRR